MIAVEDGQEKSSQASLLMWVPESQGSAAEEGSVQFVGSKSPPHSPTAGDADLAGVRVRTNASAHGELVT